MQNLIEEYWGLITTAIGSIVAWFAGKKIRVAEGKKAETDALKQMQETYDLFVHDLTERYNELRKEMDAMRKEINDLRITNIQLKKELLDWENKYDELDKKYKQN